MDNIPKIAIVVVCYNGVADTRECLESLRALTYPNYFTVLVDNASLDSTAEIVRAQFPDVTVIVSPQNTGFTGGNQTGVRAAIQRGADFLFLLNPDTTVAPDLLERLLEAWEEHPNLGALGPLMLHSDAPETIWSAGGLLNGRGQVTHLHQGEPIPDKQTYQSCEFVSGCGLLLSRSVFEHVGFFDERFFLYFEESDLCIRIRKMGYEVGTAYSARLWHKVSRSTGIDSPLTLYYMRRNQLLYLQKHGTSLGLFAAFVDSVRLLMVWTLQGNPKRAILLRALSDFTRKRFGRADGI
ncbi:glycosyltransferase family 2 protein [Armatimonas sp.]|uniref:glycosyltransferase family 2 protein n=1 Tax=Armatimonas sp. TaxID=1872638 RepID=UPI0037532443